MCKHFGLEILQAGAVKGLSPHPHPLTPRFHPHLLQANLIWYTVAGQNVLCKTLNCCVQGPGHSKKLYWMFVLASSCELLNLFGPNLVWWPITVSQSVLQKDFLAIFKVSVIIRTCVIKIWLFLLYLQICWSFQIKLFSLMLGSNSKATESSGLLVGTRRVPQIIYSCTKRHTHARTHTHTRTEECMYTRTHTHMTTLFPISVCLPLSARREVFKVPSTYHPGTFSILSETLSCFSRIPTNKGP